MVFQKDIFDAFQIEMFYRIRQKLKEFSYDRSIADGDWNYILI